MIKLELKDANDAQVLLNLIDIAVKSTGMPAAEAGLYFTRMIQDAVKPELKVVENS